MVSQPKKKVGTCSVPSPKHDNQTPFLLLLENLEELLPYFLKNTFIHRNLSNEKSIMLSIRHDHKKLKGKKA